MKRITTLSGTEYLYDDVNGKIKRQSNIRAITLVDGVGPADDVWDVLLYLNPVPLRVGAKMKMVLHNGDWRVSTMVTKIEDVEDE